MYKPQWPRVGVVSEQMRLRAESAGDEMLRVSRSVLTILGVLLNRPSDADAASSVWAGEITHTF